MLPDRDTPYDSNEDGRYHTPYQASRTTGLHTLLMIISFNIYLDGWKIDGRIDTQEKEGNLDGKGGYGGYYLHGRAQSKTNSGRQYCIK